MEYDKEPRNIPTSLWLSAFQTKMSKHADVSFQQMMLEWLDIGMGKYWTYHT